MSGVAQAVPPAHEPDGGGLFRAVPSRRNSRHLRAQRWALGEQPAEVGVLGRIIEGGDESAAGFGREVVQHPARRHDRVTPIRRLGDQRGHRLGGVATSNVDADTIGDRDGGAEALEALDLVGPHTPRATAPATGRRGRSGRYRLRPPRLAGTAVGTGTSPRVEQAIVTVEPVVILPPGSYTKS